MAPVWFITGCSAGFGLELARLVVKRGWNCVATARNPASLAELAGAGALALRLDVTKQEEIDAAVTAAEARFGRIDVLVNNAGYGYMTSVEEGVEAEIRAMYEVNVFGLFAMTRAVLPGMRTRRHGHILNISSLAGFSGFPTSGYYASTKHAVEGFSKSLAAETAACGIRVTCVEPGPFRTDWAGRSMKQTPTQIAEYQPTVGQRLSDFATKVSGHQVGDPVRAGEAMIAVVEKGEPTPHLVLGRIAFEGATGQLRKSLGAIEAVRDLALSADFPEA